MFRFSDGNAVARPLLRSDAFLRVSVSHTAELPEHPVSASESSEPASRRTTRALRSMETDDGVIGTNRKNHDSGR
jgi:hypothetical protein